MLVLANRLGSVGTADASIFSVTCATSVGGTTIPWDAMWLMWVRGWWHFTMDKATYGPTFETFTAERLAQGEPQFIIDEDLGNLRQEGEMHGHTFQTAGGGLNTTFTLTFVDTVDQSLTIDWLDGSTSGYSDLSGNEVSHTYAGASDGDTRNISVTCASEFYSSHMTTIYQWGTTAFSSGDVLPRWTDLIQVDASTDVPTFAAGATLGKLHINRDTGYQNYLEPLNVDITNWDVSNVSSMYYAFFSSQGDTQFNQDISGWDVSNVSNFHGMLFRNIEFNQDIGLCDTGNATNMEFMLGNCYAFNQDISSWDTSNVTNMIMLFRFCSSFNQDISGWNTSNVTSMRGMFESATVFSQDIRSWDVTGTGENTPSGHSFNNIFWNANAMNSRFGFQNLQNLPYATTLNWFNSA